jgi:hypothetical protein
LLLRNMGELNNHVVEDFTPAGLQIYRGQSRMALN